ncbi:RNA exonuclease 1 homolog isoform X2 [Tenebrio molitor]|uniref:RNA exonuclease 1 homolog isoform X2 n=1 Tax=Tenebrio molitor TaxID=7067 RepID=UPI003624740E
MSTTVLVAEAFPSELWAIGEHVPPGNFERRKEVASGKPKKKQTWHPRADKQSFNSPWLVKTLKNHTGPVLNMDYSSSGKYLASCGEEDPDADPDVESTTSSGSDCSKENSRPPSADPSPRTKGLSRRQRKNRRREDTSPDAKKKTKKAEISPRRSGAPRKCVGTEMTEKRFASLLHPHLLTYEQMYGLGYPVQSFEDRAIVFNINHSPFARTRRTFDVNAREFVPTTCFPPDGRISGSSSDSSEPDSEEGWECETYLPGVQRTCVRCSKGFFVTANEYLTQERCIYHWGKLRSAPRQGHRALYTCCQGKPDSPGCADCKLHVWNGIEPGLNRNCQGFVKTRPAKQPAEDGFHGVYALDCEMSYTVAGLELTKVTVVAVDGAVVYETFVRPKNAIVDYNTRFSGITARDLKAGPTKTLHQVQNDLRGFVKAETILIGHGLENDLRALKMVHANVVDTSLAFPHYSGPHYKHSLKQLMATYLKRDIQCGVNGHDSYEDAAACVQLMIFKVQRENGGGYLVV